MILNVQSFLFLGVSFLLCVLVWPRIFFVVKYAQNVGECEVVVGFF